MIINIEIFTLLSQKLARVCRALLTTFGKQVTNTNKMSSPIIFNNCLAFQHKINHYDLRLVLTNISVNFSFFN